MTGKLASGNACARTDQVPWSMPQESTSAPTPGFTTSLNSSGQPRQFGLRVRHVEELRREAAQSWMVRSGIAVTAVTLMYQCAETTRIARGRGMARPNARQALVTARAQR